MHEIISIKKYVCSYFTAIFFLLKHILPFLAIYDVLKFIITSQKNIISIIISSWIGIFNSLLASNAIWSGV